MEPISIGELRRHATEAPFEAAIQVQLDRIAEKKTKDGKPYLELLFADGTDALTIRVWSDHPMFTRVQPLPAPALLELSGQWVAREKYGIQPDTWDFRELDAEEREEFLRGPQSTGDRQRADLAYIAETVSGLADPRLRGLCLRFLQTYEELFLRTAAARKYHHARRGGLVEHVAQMMRAAVALSGVYDTLNADLLISGVLFHDCGKLWENSYEKLGFTMPYQKTSELLGHIPLGIEVVNKLWRDLCKEESAASWDSLIPCTDDLRLHLLHLVASHHGTHEFGSPVLPKTPEAILLHFIDNIDAKLEMFASIYENAPLLAENIFEGRRPIYQPLVRPLPHFQDPDQDAPAKEIAP